MMFSSVYKQVSCSLQDWLVLFFQITPDYKKFYLLGLKTSISFLGHGLIITVFDFWLLVPVFRGCEQFRKASSPPENISGFLSVNTLLLPYIFRVFFLFSCGSALPSKLCCNWFSALSLTSTCLSPPGRDLAEQKPDVVQEINAEYSLLQTAGVFFCSTPRPPTLASCRRQRWRKRASAWISTGRFTGGEGAAVSLLPIYLGTQSSRVQHRALHSDFCMGVLYRELPNSQAGWYPFSSLTAGCS